MHQESEREIGLQSHIASLGQVLRTFTRLTAPPYQRSYSWTQAEVSRLIQDVRAAMAREASYYFVGLLVLVGTQPDEAEIVDGLQRLATLSMVLAYVRDHLDGEEQAQLQQLLAPASQPPEGPRGLQMRRVDAQFFARIVQEPGAMAELAARTDCENETHALLIEAAKAIAEALAGMDRQGLQHLLRTLLGKVIFSVMRSQDRDGASLLFRVLNDRGKDPSDAAMIKSELLSQAGLSEEGADGFAHAWDLLEERLGRTRFEGLLDMAPLIVSGRPDQTRGDLGSFRRDVLASVPAERFLAEDLPRYARALEAIDRRAIDAGIHTAQVRRRLMCLSWLRDRYWLAPAVAFLADHAGDGMSEEANALTLRFFERLERLAFATFFGAIKSDRRQERFAQVVRARGRPEALFGAKGALELTEAEHRDLVQRLNAPFQSQAKAKERRIVAWRVEAALGQAFEMSSQFTLEHVLPMRPSGPWLGAFPVAEQRETLTHLLGNWAIVTEWENQIAADKNYRDKLGIFFRKDKKEPVRPLAADLAQYSEWTPIVIRMRHERLVAHLCADWDLLKRPER